MSQGPPHPTTPLPTCLPQNCLLGAEGGLGAGARHCSPFSLTSLWGDCSLDQTDAVLSHMQLYRPHGKAAWHAGKSTRQSPGPNPLATDPGILTGSSFPTLAL